MFARVTRYHFEPARLDEFVGKLDGIKAQVAEISGLVDAYSAWREDGHGVTVAIYESQAEAAAAIPHVQAIWSGLAGLLTSEPEPEYFDHVAHLKP